MAQGVYHERQRLELCALHSINCVMPEDAPKYRKQELDELCEAVTPRRCCNPHRAWCGTGFYDVNIIMLALDHRGFDVAWFDSRRPARDLPPPASVAGFIFNRAYYRIPILPIKKSRHWFAVRAADGAVYNLDSKLSAPEARAALVPPFPGPRAPELTQASLLQRLSDEAAFYALAADVMRRGGHALVVTRKAGCPR